MIADRIKRRQEEKGAKMNGVQNKRKEVKKIREQMTDEELFLSKAYQESLGKFARVLGGNQAVRLVLSYIKEKNSRVAFTDGNLIYLNAANQMTEQFPQRDEKMASHEGLTAHECGHIRYSDFERRTVYVNGFSQGRIFPRPPQGQTPAEKRAAEELKQFVRRKDRVAVSVIAMVASHLNNVLEDVYIESKMCQRYPGSVRMSIQKNAAVLLGQIPTASERRAEKNDGLDIMIDLILRYARSGRTEAEKEYDRQYRTCLEACRGRIDEAVESEDPDIRFWVTNELLLKLWRYVKKAIREARADLGKDFLKLSPQEQEKKAREYLDKNRNPISLSAGYGGECRTPKAIEGWDGSLDSEEEKSREGCQEEDKDSQGEGQEQKNGSSQEETQEQKNGSSQEEGQEQKNDRSQEEENQEEDQKEDQKGDHSSASLPRIILLWKGQTDVQSQGEDCEEEKEEEACLAVVGEDGAGIGEMNGNLFKILTQAAEEAYEKQAEVNLKRYLEKEAKELSPEGIHRGVPVRVFRDMELGAEIEAGYREIEAEIKKAAGRLRQTVEEILIRKEGGVMSGLYMGKRLSRGNLYRQDGKIFEKRVLPEEGFSVAFGVLVDNSGSMVMGDRIGQARKAALVLYEFCRSLSIPITVYGHTTCDVLSCSSWEEGVAMYSFAEFDSVDGKDHLRIQSMKAQERNRDGLALRFMGRHLAEREEEVKILTLISDGSPHAAGYSGETAKEDLKLAKQELHKMGVTLFAAAIGDDREEIEDIYGDSFLNISNLKTMPQKLAALLLRYIR